jgi:hypothetical protein
MNWTRIANTAWQSDCGKYRIDAMIKRDTGYDYAAVYQYDARKHIGIGIFNGVDSIANAHAAKQACIDHEHKRLKAGYM